MKRRDDEHKLQAAILDLIKIGKSHPDIFAVAIPNAARRSLRMGVKMKQEGLTPGAADLCILMPAGRSAWLELKTPKGVQSINQKGFEARCKRLDHAYALARSVDEAIAALRRLGV